MYHIELEAELKEQKPRIKQILLQLRCIQVRPVPPEFEDVFQLTESLSVETLLFYLLV